MVGEASESQAHGALVEVFEIGVLLVGPSGIGKSECALGLIERGHALVADDVVRIRREGSRLVGSAPEVIRDFMEIRGIGLLYLPDLYGPESVRASGSIDLVCRLEEWREGLEFDRVGLDRPTEDFAGVALPVVRLPARPAGSMATLIEAAARDHRQRALGSVGAERIDARLRGGGRCVSAEATAQSQIVFVSGLSGSGKTTAMAALEDLSFYCVDNLPPQLVVQFIDLCQKADPPIDKVAIAVDAREERFLSGFPAAARELRTSGTRVRTLFLECADEVLVNRYSETRRVHPLSPAGSVEEGIARERELLVEVASLADVVIDTSSLNVHQLKEGVIRNVAGREKQTVVNLLSFGFRYGPPRSAELLFDVRFLANPYFEEELRPRTGLDSEVAAYVLADPASQDLLDRLRGLLEFLLPLYDREGKAYVTIGVGCTGGRHRSVAVSAALASTLRERGREVNLEHRDAERAA